MTFPKPVLTIASIGVSPTPINMTIFSETEPPTRDNGGDLQNGDRWFDSISGIESLYVDGDWKQINSVNLNN